MRVLFLTLLSSWLVFTSCNHESSSEYDLLIMNANVLDIEQGSVLSEKFVAVSKDTIRVVGDMANLGNKRANEIVDIDGKFLMPGLWDNHVHFRGGDSLIKENQQLLPWFLAYGITTVVDAGGDITPAVLDWKQSIEHYQLDGPDILTSGPKLDGDPPMWEGSIAVTDKNEVEAALDSLQLLNIDYVKIYNGSLQEEIYYQIIDRAEKRGLKTTGHIPLEANLIHAIEQGLDGAQHLDYLVKPSSSKGDSIGKLDLGYLDKLGLMMEYYDSISAMSYFRQLGDVNFSFTPTLHIGQTLANITTADHSEDSLLAYLGDGILSTYQLRINGMKNLSPERLSLFKGFEEHVSRMIKPMHDSGVIITAGSDCGAFNSYVYPGESLIKELMALVDQGLSERAALASSIINGPRFFNKDLYYGSVAPEKVAHLIVLRENPLEDINNISSLASVIKGDRVYHQAEIYQMMQETRSK